MINKKTKKLISLITSSWILLGSITPISQVISTKKSEKVNNEYSTSILLSSYELSEKDIEDIYNIEYLQVDLSNTTFYNLTKFKNLKSIEIINAQFLTNDLINELNAININNIYLKFDKRYVTAFIQNGTKFDLNTFKNKSSIKGLYFMKSQEDNFYEQVTNEDDSILFMEFFDNIEGIDFDYNNYKKINDKVQNIYESLDIKNINDSVDKIIVISKYILEKFNYDYDTANSNYLEKNIVGAYYNIFPLTSTLLKNEQQTGAICINYAEALEALLIKANFDAQVVKNEEHAWNMVTINNKTYNIDLTYLDNDNECLDCINKYLNGTISVDEVVNKLLIESSTDNIHAPVNGVEFYENKTIQHQDLKQVYGTNKEIGNVVIDDLVNVSKIIINYIEVLLIVEALLRVIYFGMEKSNNKQALENSSFKTK